VKEGNKNLAVIIAFRKSHKSSPVLQQMLKNSLLTECGVFHLLSGVLAREGRRLWFKQIKMTLYMHVSSQ
jgi:hypothetical protein